MSLPQALEKIFGQATDNKRKREQERRTLLVNNRSTERKNNPVAPAILELATFLKQSDIDGLRERLSGKVQEYAREVSTAQSKVKIRYINPDGGIEDGTLGDKALSENEFQKGLLKFSQAAEGIFDALLILRDNPQKLDENHVKALQLLIFRLYYCLPTEDSLIGMAQGVNLRIYPVNSKRASVGTLTGEGVIYEPAAGESPIANNAFMDMDRTPFASISESDQKTIREIVCRFEGECPSYRSSKHKKLPGFLQEQIKRNMLHGIITQERTRSPAVQ